MSDRSNKTPMRAATLSDIGRLAKVSAMAAYTGLNIDESFGGNAKADNCTIHPILFT